MIKKNKKKPQIARFGYTDFKNTTITRPKKKKK